MGPLEVIVRTGVLPIARGVPREVVLRAARILAGVGINVIEITVDSPDAFATIHALRRLDDSLMVGAGTIRTAILARQAAEAGAQFLVTPHVDAAVAAEAQALELPVILGALTPTEIMDARAKGAELVKVFPAAPLGAEYVRQILAPLREVPLVPTGGITPANALDFISAGAVAVGIGSALLGPRAADAQWLSAQAQALTGAVQQGRQSRASRHA